MRRTSKKCVVFGLSCQLSPTQRSRFHATSARRSLLCSSPHPPLSYVRPFPLESIYSRTRIIVYYRRLNQNSKHLKNPDQQKLQLRADLGDKSTARELTTLSMKSIMKGTRWSKILSRLRKRYENAMEASSYTIKSGK